MHIKQTKKNLRSFKMLRFAASTNRFVVFGMGFVMPVSAIIVLISMVMISAVSTVPLVMISGAMVGRASETGRVVLGNKKWFSLYVSTIKSFFPFQEFKYLTFIETSLHLVTQQKQKYQIYFFVNKNESNFFTKQLFQFASFRAN